MLEEQQLAIVLDDIDGAGRPGEHVPDPLLGSPAAADLAMVNFPAGWTVIPGENQVAAAVNVIDRAVVASKNLIKQPATADPDGCIPLRLAVAEPGMPVAPQFRHRVDDIDDASVTGEQSLLKPAVADLLRAPIIGLVEIHQVSVVQHRVD